MNGAPREKQRRTAVPIGAIVCATTRSVGVSAVSTARRCSSSAHKIVAVSPRRQANDDGRTAQGVNRKCGRFTARKENDDDASSDRVSERRRSDRHGCNRARIIRGV